MADRGPKKNRGAKPQRAVREVSAGGVVIRRGSDAGFRILLIRDSYGHWGFPKGHLEKNEPAAAAAARETTEETGLADLVLHGPLETIDWYFRLRGKLIHKYCHFYLFESAAGEPVPQEDEGITECVWFAFDDAVTKLGYENARGVLRKAGTLAQQVLDASAAGGA
ncbi:MAG: NUDIX domain-containing protein [Gemmatimonadales bacterium]